MNRKFLIAAALLAGLQSAHAQVIPGGGGTGGTGGGTLTVTDGTHSVTSATTLTFGNGLVVGGSAGSATVGPSLTQNAQTSTSYALASTDAGKTVTFSNASAVAASIVSATTTNFTAGYGTALANIGTLGSSGNVTLTAGGSSKFGNNLQTLVMSPGQMAEIGSDGTNYPMTALTLPVMGSDTLLGNFSGTPNYPIASSALSSCSAASSALTYNTTTHAFGCNTISGSGTVTTSGSPASGNLAKFSGGTVVTNGDLSGDITTAGTLAATLATVNSNVGTFGDATHCANFTVNAKGLITAAAQSTSCPGAGGSAFYDRQYIAGDWYWPRPFTAGTGTANGTGSIRWKPAFFPTPVTLGEVGHRVSTSSAGGNCQIALYASSGTTGRPTGSALVSSASLSTASTGVITTSSSGFSYSITTPGLYWFGENCDNGTVALMGDSDSNALSPYMVGATSAANLTSGGTSAKTNYSTTQTFGTWPTNPPITESASSGQVYFEPLVKILSVP